MNERVTIVIPTIGRKSLNQTIEKILAETEDYFVIVVVEKGYESVFRSYFDYFEKDSIRVLFGSGSGVSANLNEAIPHIKTEFCAFFSDDDVWVPGGLSEQVKFLDEQSLDFVLGHVLFESSKVPAHRPEINLRDSFFPLFEVSWWSKSPYYVSLITFLGRSNEVLRSTFDERLTGFEDIEWLLRLEKRGLRFNQINVLRAIIDVDYRRNSNRDDSKLRSLVFSRLNLIHQSLGLAYYRKIAPRNHILAGNFLELKKIRIERNRMKDGFRFKFSVLVDYLGSILLAFIIKNKTWVLNSKLVGFFSR